MRLRKLHLAGIATVCAVALIPAAAVAGVIDAGTDFVVRFDGATDREEAGTAVVTGDFNGDGITDYAIGAQRAESHGRWFPGAVHVVFGPVAGPTFDLASLAGQGYRIDGPDAGMIGSPGSLANAGDVNGDGKDDLLVGAPRYDRGEGYSGGAAFVVFGKDDGANVDLAAAGDWGYAIYGEGSEETYGCCGDDAFGTSVAGLGDVNGDGIPDLVIGGPNTDVGPFQDAGRAYVIFGKADTAPIEAASLGGQGWIIEGFDWFQRVGTAVAGPGDVNGDGIPDILLGSPGMYPGHAHVVFGKADTTPVQLNALGSQGYALVDPDGGRAGWSVAGAGDVNGDGKADLLIGAPDGDPSGEDLRAGAVYVVHGKSDSTPVDLGSLGSTGYWIAGGAIDLCEPDDPECGPTRDRAGVTVANAGDFDGDGRDDILIGGRNVAFVVFGRPGTTPVRLDALGALGFRFTGPDGLGEALTSAGDVTGDGKADVLLGAPEAETLGRWGAGVALLVGGRIGEEAGPGLLTGRVTADGFGALAGASVEACAAATGACATTTTDAEGNYAFSLGEGTYSVTARPPVPAPVADLVPQTRGAAVVGDRTTRLDFNLSTLIPPPPGTSVSPSTTASTGIPSINSAGPWTLRTTGCSGGTATATVSTADGELWSGTMSEGPAGTYTATVPALDVRTFARVTIEIECPDGTTEHRRFDVWLWIDPSGIVSTVEGEPIQGATVTLLRYEDGEWVVVPDGSEIMSPANRTNPDLTDANGFFQWDVIPGLYKVRAEKEGCTSPDDPSQAYTETDDLVIPPPALDLDLRLDCATEPEDTTPPEISCAASPDTLWPPNNKLVRVDVTVTVSDDESGVAGFTLVSVTSNEPAAGDIVGWDVGTADTSGQLAAKRLGRGSGRVYTLTYRALDNAGNAAECTVEVRVPHDQRR